MDSLRINSSVPAMNIYRHVYNNSVEATNSAREISSGLKINTAADGPADLVLSEVLRSQIAGITQAISNNEISTSVAQTAESAMDEANLLLVNMRQLAIHASNEGASDDNMLEADQAEYENAMNSLDHIAKFTAFGSKKLLDGGHSSRGLVVGNGLTFIQGGAKAISSPGNEGYNIDITRTATKAFAISANELSQEIINKGEKLQFIENGKTVAYTTKKTDTSKSIVSRLNAKFNLQNMGLAASLSDNNHLVISHKQYGSKHHFSVSGSTPGIFSDKGGEVMQINNGQDVAGFISDYRATGDGEYLIGAEGTPVDGLKLRYEQQNENGIDERTSVGAVYFEQNSMRFQIGESYGATVNFVTPGIFANMLGRNVANDSQFESLRQVDLRTFQGAQDALKLIDSAQYEISIYRAELGAIQKNTLEENNRYLRAAREHITSSESVIRDTDIAEELSRYAKEKLKTEVSMTMLSHANKNPRDVLGLLK